MDVWAFSSQWASHNTAVGGGGGLHISVVLSLLEVGSEGTVSGVLQTCGRFETECYDLAGECSEVQLLGKHNKVIWNGVQEVWGDFASQS